jgi:hypothetical protein
MSDRSGQASALTAFTPIDSGRAEELQAYLRALPLGAESPLARLPRTHLARWVIVDRLPTDPPKSDTLDRPYLLFTCCIDGDVESYLRELAERLPEEADAIWGHCAGCPGARDAAAFTRWLLDHHVPTALFVAAYPNATVHDVRGSLAARDQLLRFVLGAQELDPEARLERFRAAFPAA